jgi:hypothetical protein
MTRWRRRPRADAADGGDVYLTYRGHADGVALGHDIHAEIDVASTSGSCEHRALHT